MMQGLASPVAVARSPATDVVIATPDGVQLAATYRAGSHPQAPGILLLHGVGASRDAVAGTAEWLAANGYATLAIDFRGHGQSTLRPRSFGWNESVDAHAAFAWLRRRQRGARIAVIGISMGGAASLLGPGGPLPADAQVLQAVYPDIRHAIRGRIADRLGAWPAMLMEPLLSLQVRPRIGVWPAALSPIRAIARFPAPVMVIGGQEDRYTPPSETRALYAAALNGRDLWLVPGGDHAAICMLSGEAYQRRIAKFLKETIGPADIAGPAGLKPT